MRSLLALLVAALCLAPTTSRAKCAMEVLEYQVVSHPGDEIPAGGGVLVTWSTSHEYDGERKAGDPTANASWRFKLGKKKVATTLETIAPGLTLYRPTVVKKGKARVHTLIGDGGTSLGKFKFSAKTRAAFGPAPGVNAVKVKRDDRGRGVSVTATVTLDATPPDDAYALVLRAAGGAAISWGLVTDRTSPSIVVFHHNGRCDVVPPDMRSPSAGESVDAFWVDKFGRQSPASAAVVASDK